MDEKVISRLAELRKPFEPHQISKLPKPTKADAPKGKCKECGGWHGLPAVHLDYVGHAALTDRLLDVDPLWTWEPLAVTADGLPMLDKDGGLWIRLTVCGVTRLGYGDAAGKSGTNATKERIGDALRNAAMRFGAALDLWHKGELHREEQEEPERSKPANQPLAVVSGGQAEERPTFHEHLVEKCKAAYREAGVTPTVAGVAAALDTSESVAAKFFNEALKFLPVRLDASQLYRVTYFAQHGKRAELSDDQVSQAMAELGAAYESEAAA